MISRSSFISFAFCLHSGLVYGFQKFYTLMVLVWKHLPLFLFLFSTMFFALQKHAYETGRNYFQGNFKSVFNTLSPIHLQLSPFASMFTFISLSQIKILFPCHYGTDYCHYYFNMFSCHYIDKLFSLLLDMFSLCFISGIICIEMRISWELFMINA